MRKLAVLIALTWGCDQGGERERAFGPETPRGPCESEWTVDEECTGFPIVCTSLSYDEWGNVTATETDRFCDGETDGC